MHVYMVRFTDHFEAMFGVEDHPAWDKDRVYRPDTLQVCEKQAAYIAPSCVL